MLDMLEMGVERYSLINDNRSHYWRLKMKTESLEIL